MASLIGQFPRVVCMYIECAHRILCENSPLECSLHERTARNMYSVYCYGIFGNCSM